MHYPHQLRHVVGIARTGSEFYSEWLRDVDPNPSVVEELPIVPFETMNRICHEDMAPLLTGALDGGIVSASSGTTGKPKFSIMSRDEWAILVERVALRHWQSGLVKSGDVVANLTPAGRTRLAFLAVTHSLQVSPVSTTELAISGNEPVDYMYETCRTLGANVLAGLTMTLVNLAYYIRENGLQPLDVDTVLYGGETMYGAQYEYLRGVFPKARFASFMYASAEAGLVGYASDHCRYDEHVVHADSAILEIVDENGQPVTAAGVSGRLVATSLIKTLMPFIRTEVGDIGHWVDPPEAPERRFVVTARIHTSSSLAAEREQTIRALIESARSYAAVLAIQLHMDDHGQSRLLVALGNPRDQRADVAARLELTLGAEMGERHAPSVVVVGPEEITPTGIRSAKHKLVVAS